MYSLLGGGYGATETGPTDIQTREIVIPSVGSLSPGDRLEKSQEGKISVFS